MTSAHRVSTVRSLRDSMTGGTWRRFAAVDATLQAIVRDFRLVLLREVHPWLASLLDASRPNPDDRERFWLTETDPGIRGLRALMMSLVASPDIFMPFGFDAVRYSAEPKGKGGESSDAGGDIEDVWESSLSGFLEMDASDLPDAAFRAILGDHALEVVRIWAAIRRGSVSGFLRSDTAIVCGPQQICTQCFQAFAKITQRGIEYRELSGTWITSQGVLDRVTPEPDEGTQHTALEWFQLILSKLEDRALRPPPIAPTEVAMPMLLLPHFRTERQPLQSTSSGLLEELQTNGVASLRELHWRDLEELVAELLMRMGLAVTVTKRTWDGGRDIVATGELLVGEPTSLAIEVKQKAVVGVSDVRPALAANREFPALLFATAGRFSAGVFRERIQHNDQLRLYLKDGVALGQWLDLYGQSNRG